MTDLPELTDGSCRVCHCFKYITRKWWRAHGMICKQCHDKQEKSKSEKQKKSNQNFGDQS
jgi:hypothetical protein